MMSLIKKLKQTDPHYFLILGGVCYFIFSFVMRIEFHHEVCNLCVKNTFLNTDYQKLNQLWSDCEIKVSTEIWEDL